jgi:PIN domain
MAEYFVCLDTNILVDLVEKFGSGKTTNAWEKLLKLVRDNEATLLVPEVTLLELETCVRDAEEELLAATTKTEADTKNQLLKEYLAQSLKDWRKKIVEGRKTEAGKFDKWLRANAFLPYTESIGHLTKRRLIAGRFPKPPKDDPKANAKAAQWLRDQDCSIIDSLVTFFAGKLDDRILAFATRDGGFGPIRKKEGIGTLDETFQEGLPPTQVFTDLSKLVEFVKDKRTVAFPTPQEVEEEKRREIEEQLQHESAPEGGAPTLRKITVNFDFPLETGPPGGWQDEQSQQNANNTAFLLLLDQERRRRNAMYDELPPPPDEQPPDEQPPDEQPPDEQPPDEQPPDEQPPDEQPPDEQPPDEQPPDEQPPDEQPPQTRRK